MSNEEYYQRIREYRKKIELERDAARAAAEAAPAEVAADPVELALTRLADPEETREARAASLQHLKALSFSSETFSDWLPRFLEGLRSASRSDHAGLRELAFEALIAYGSREDQQSLIDGLADPEAALVSPAVALRLLSQDPHAPAREVARSLADTATDPETRLESLRVLASDPESVDRFAGILADPGEATDARTLAATALGSLDRARLRSVAAEMEQATEAVSEAREDVDVDVEAHLNSLLDLPE